MKLNKNTRELVNEGTRLKQEGMEVEVVRVIELQRGKCLTVKILKHLQEWCVGRYIYSQPMSWFYGMEVLI